MSITLTQDQQAAYQAFDNFLSDRTEPAMIISGYAGTGKSTLVKRLIDDLPSLLKVHSLIDKTMPKYDVRLTATTNKAARALSEATGYPVVTIHSLLGLVPSSDGRVKPTQRSKTIKNTLLIVDEASYIDYNLLTEMDALLLNCKIVFIGDPAQLPPVRSGKSAVWHMNYPEVRLTQIVRQAEGNPIIDLAHTFRRAVYNEASESTHACDGDSVLHLTREQFEAALVNECNRPDWDSQQSRYLAYSNRAVCHYNKEVLSYTQGRSILKKGDIAVVNKYVRSNQGQLKTDSVVEIVSISPDRQYKTDGFSVVLDNGYTGFMPESFQAYKDALKRHQDNFLEHTEIQDTWLDLRPAYCCTIHKSQGSTYDRVFIDLDDLRTARLSDSMKCRLLYVAISRAREQVVLTGQVVKESPDESSSQTKAA